MDAFTDKGRLAPLLADDPRPGDHERRDRAPRRRPLRRVFAPRCSDSGAA